jgi:hypothetical protein
LPTAAARDGQRADGAGARGADAAGPALHEYARDVPGLHHGQCRVDGDGAQGFDTRTFSNTLDAGFPVPGAGDSLTPFLESDPVLGDVDEHFSGDYLNQETIMRAARAAGMSTATIGKLGPALIFDHTERNGEQTIVIDDSTGRAGGIPLGAEMQKRLKAAGLDVQAPTRGENGKAGDFQTPGTLVANTIQQTYFVNATTKVVLPLFKERGKPFMLVFWSRDPDGTQHNQGDASAACSPGSTGRRRSPPFATPTMTLRRSSPH